MKRKSRISGSTIFILVLAFINLLLIVGGIAGFTGLLWWLIPAFPLLVLGIYDITQTRHAIVRNYPIVGHLRYLFESIRPELRQYFFESDLDGKPFSRRQRSVVYQRAKNQKETVAFGMQADPNQPGYEWVAHSVYPVHLEESSLRVNIGNKQCTQVYNASVINIGAMSYGALSKAAITALNEGAKIGNFAHNTGEGSISPYHLLGGDLIWQIGTGYFGCRDAEGNFNPGRFRKNALRPQVKMIELKLSQGAKPGHGGILPASKNTPEIAAIRNVEPATTVKSPAHHSAFNSPEGLLIFLKSLRELSDGKPVGFKICIGDKKEFTDILDAVQTTGVIPDFISIDGAEGGTGAAPLEFTDYLGMPLYDALAFVKMELEARELNKDIKVIAAGKIITGFDILKVLALGASAVYSARGMMLSLGCIQALICDTGKCPVGVATQNPKLYKALDPTDKKVRVANYHANTIKATLEIMEACGMKNIQDVSAAKFFRKINEQEFRSFEEIYFKAGKSLKNNPFQTNLN